MKFYKVVRAIVGWFFRLTMRLKVTGELPSDGNVLICANHTSMLDPIVLGVAFERPIRFMAKKELFAFKPLGAFFRMLGAFPVDRGGSDIGALKKAVALLKSGEAVCVFPQGTRRKYVDPAATEVKHGAAMIAYRSGSDVIPVFIKTKDNRLCIFKRAEIIVGDKLTIAELGFEKGGTKEYTAAADIIFSRICALGGYTYLLSQTTDKETKE